MRNFRLNQIKTIAFLIFGAFAVSTFSQIKPSAEPTATPATETEKTDHHKCNFRSRQKCAQYSVGNSENRRHRNCFYSC